MFLIKPVARQIFGETAYIFGGLVGASETATRYYGIDSYDGTTYSTGPTVTLLPFDAGCDVLNSKVFVFGGQGNDLSISLSIFSYDGNTASTLAMTTYTEGDSACTLGSYIYTFGSYYFGSGGTAGTSRLIRKFDGATLTTESTLMAPSDPYSGVVRGPSTSVLGNVIYIFGGSAADGDTVTTKRISKWNGSTLSVEDLSMPSPSAGSANTLNGSIYIIDAYNSTGILKFTNGTISNTFVNPYLDFRCGTTVHTGNIKIFSGSNAAGKSIRNFNGQTMSTESVTTNVQKAGYTSATLTSMVQK